ncbi:MAG: phosphoenolpyruvate carboxykinase (ATP), partial [Acidimicrobiales bacterium]
MTIPTADVASQLESRFGITGLELRANLSQSELFDEAIANDRGRVTLDGPDDAQKAFPTSLGKDGPLVFFSDPECTGRPVADTFCVDRPDTTDRVWWKNGFSKFDAAAFDALLPRVVEHLNQRGEHLYVTDVFCGWDPTFAEPYRFVGEFATHAYF